MTAESNYPHSQLDPVESPDEIRRLEREVARLRGLLETEREAMTRDMAAGAAELARYDDQGQRQRRRIDRLKVRVQRLRKRAEERGRRVAELETELDRYRGSRAVRIAMRLSGRRGVKGGR